MQFYVLHGEVGCETESEYESVGQRNLGDPPRCPVCGEFCGMMTWLPPYRVRLHRHGSILGDIVFKGGDEVLVSQKFVDAWSACGLKGLAKLHPVEIMSVRPKSLRKSLQSYYWLAIQSTVPRIDRAQSVFIAAEPECSLCGCPFMIDAILALRIDESSWSGEDIFVPWGAVELVVTQNVVDMAQEYGLTNVTTTPIEEYCWDPLRLRDSVS